MQRHLALVEDNETILANYADFLEDAGFRVDRYGTPHEALRGLQADTPDLLLLDIELHDDLDAGYDICREMRRRDPTLPVIFVTSHGSDVDKISGLLAGADDHLTKPVSLDYLIVRIEALLLRVRTLTGSRASSHSAPAAPSSPPGEIVVDEMASTLRWRRQRVNLTLTQFWMTVALYRAVGQPLTAKELMQAGRITVEPNTIAAHVKAIRAAFTRVDAAFDCIRTERNRGYRWVSS